MCSEENPKSSSGSNVKGVIEATTGLVKAIPVYEDAIQPAAKQVGKSLETVTKAVNVALAPISIMIWGYEKVTNFIDASVSPKLENIPEEQIITPDPHVVGPALDALRYTGNNEALRDLFANLIANSMDSKTAINAHPAFVDIIKSMTSDEAKIISTFQSNIYKPIIDVKLKYKEGDKGEHNLLNNYSIIGDDAKCEHPELVPNYIDNLCRLGLLVMPSGRHLIAEHAYDGIIKTSKYKEFEEKYNTDITSSVIVKKYIELTEFGGQFKLACVIDK